MSAVLKTQIYWVAVMLIPLVYTVVSIPPDMKIMIYTLLTPLLLAFLSRQPEFAGVNERVIIATGITAFIISYAVTRGINNVKEAVKDPSKSRTTYISSYLGLVVIFAILMYGFSMALGMYPKQPINSL